MCVCVCARAAYRAVSVQQEGSMQFYLVRRRSPTCALIIPNRRQATLDWLIVNTQCHVARRESRVDGHRFVRTHTHTVYAP